jgi:lysophospholipase L1-like esterase
VGIPHPGAFGGLSHDALHRRTTINENKASDAKAIYVFGGSTAYDVGNIDGDTWPSVLSGLLGPHYQVQNYGVPAYSSLGSMIQSLFVFRDIKPVCAVYYLGWNDLMLSHLKVLSNDYATFESPNMQGVLAVGYRPGNLANFWLMFQLADRAIQAGSGYTYFGQATITDQKDMRLSRIFTDNVELIADIDRHFDVRPIFVPQILNYDFIEARHRDWHFIPAKAVRALMREMNLDLQRATTESGAAFLDAPLGVDWQDSDFLDDGHFSKQGSAKFAAAIAPAVQNSCQ